MKSFFASINTNPLVISWENNFLESRNRSIRNNGDCKSRKKSSYFFSGPRPERFNIAGLAEVWQDRYADNGLRETIGTPTTRWTAWALGQCISIRRWSQLAPSRDYHKDNSVDAGAQRVLNRGGKWVATSEKLLMLMWKRIYRVGKARYY